MSTQEGRIVSVNISEKTGTVKEPVGKARINEHGVAGDAHAGDWHRQVSVLSREDMEAFGAASGREMTPGEFGENLTVDGLDLDRVAPLDRFRVGAVELEVTQIGKKCHGKGCAIYTEVGECVMPAKGLFCRVVKVGEVAAGDTVTLHKRPLTFHVITTSDRAARGEYADRGGPRIRELLAAHFDSSRWEAAVTGRLLPDDVQLLRQELVKCRDAGTDVVITTGGTGVGPRDITVDVVADLLDRSIPGIMEHIRVKYGAENPNALLSRGVAGMMGRTVVYTLPGSVKAVNEYMREILLSLEHLIKMVHGLGH